MKRCPAGMNVPLLIVPMSPTVPGGAPSTELGMNASCWPLPITSPPEKYVPTGSNRNAFQPELPEALDGKVVGRADS